MRSFWLIAKHEYRKRVSKRSFLFATLGIPLLMSLVIGISIFFSLSSQSDKPLGYVDQAGVLTQSHMAGMQGEPDAIEMRSFPDQAAARSALEQEEIQAYYLVPAGYPGKGQVELYYWNEAPSQAAREAFGRFLSASLASGQSPAMQARLAEGPSITGRIPCSPARPSIGVASPGC